MHAKSSKPPRMFQCDAVDISRDLGGKMSSKPSKWLFNVKGGRHERIRESFLSLDLFSLKFKNILWPYYGGQSPPSPTMDPSLTGISVRASRIDLHADNMAVKSTSRLGFYVLHDVKRAFTHVRAEKKRSAK